jgi:uncharacterized membrane protein SpoIIM required for sporulation
MKVWNWFPHAILNVPTLTMATSLGLLLVIRFFKPIIIRSRKQNAEDVRSTGELLSNSFAISALHAIILLVGWLVSLFL